MKSSANKDFSHQDLRGRSFEGQDLTGADFSYADIRGINFKGAILKGANFANAKGGITKKSFVLYLLMILVMSALLFGFITACNLFVTELFIKGILEAFNAKIAVNIITYTLLFYIIYMLISVIFIRKGRYSLWSISLITALAIFGIEVVVLILNRVTIYATIVGTIFTPILLAMSIIIAGALVIVLAIAIVVDIIVAIVATIIGVLGMVSIIGINISNESMAGIVAWCIATLIQLILSFYIAYRTHKEDEQFDIYRKFGLFFSSMFGTNFDSANLTDANFSKANLKYCRFSKETITIGTCFQNAENLKIARLSGTILKNKAVRELLATGNGKNQSYAGMNLKGAYLVGADLSGADLHEADLIGATLENADLRNANLSRIQALGVEFRGADFTGACLEAWNIDSTTQLDGAKADYVYLLNNKLERRPASGIFGQGEFAKLFNEVLDTVDFIFRNGIDWQAFMVSFDNLREKIRVESDNAEISIQSIANKGDGVFVVKVNVPMDADKAEIHSDFRKEYDTQLKLIEEKYQAKLAGKEELITAYHHEIVHYRQQNIDMLKIIQEQPQIHITAIEKVSMIHARDIKDSTVIAGDENEVNRISSV